MRLLNMIGAVCTVNDLATRAYAHCHSHGPLKEIVGKERVYYYPMTKQAGFRMLNAEKTNPETGLEEAILVLWRTFNGIPDDYPYAVEPDYEIIQEWLEGWGLQLFL